MKDLSQNDLSFEIWLLLGQTHRTMLNLRQKELNAYKLHTRQAGVLLTIKALGDRATPLTISKRLLLKHNTVSEVLTRMEKKGLVRRLRDTQRRNQVNIELTLKGLEASTLAGKQDSIHKVISALSDEQKQQLKSCLTILRKTAVES